MRIHKAVATFVCITTNLYNLFKKRNVNNLHYKDIKKHYFLQKKIKDCSFFLNFLHSLKRKNEDL